MFSKTRLKLTSKALRYFYFGFFLILAGCSTLINHETAAQKRLSLTSAERLKPGMFSKNDILQLLGNPDKVVSLKNNVDIEYQDEAWLYLNEAKDSTRISLIFDKHSILSKTNWFTESGDPEANLQNALRRYLPVNFVRASIPWTSNHFAPNEEIYRNADLGIEIVHAKGNQFVESIVFSEPTRNPTAGK